MFQFYTAVNHVFQFYALSIVYQIVLIAILVVMAIVEAIRLYIGYVGNLMEKVSECWRRDKNWIQTLNPGDT